ncbi:hypothetical protein TRIUR3_19631 [Triticum urartu]|uniref:Uncharacterized protein n=1 Tax=Triticum urartu TaxID=4572 RepID=M7YHQ9_TRIUA|nr:hypothetical protein TRIUR3_19631 [Triticum urartu]
MEDFYREIYAVDGVHHIDFPQHYPVSCLLGPYPSSSLLVTAAAAVPLSLLTPLSIIAQDASRWSAASATSLPVRRQGGMPCPGSKEEWSLWQVADRAFELGAPNVIILPRDVADPDNYNRFVQAIIDHYGQWRPWKA